MTSTNPDASCLPDTAHKPQSSLAASAATEKSALNVSLSSLMEAVVDDANIERAWKNVKVNKGAPGPDGITLDAFFETFRHHWPEVRRQLLEGTYRPGPSRRKSIPKPDGGTRDLGIPNVIDRLIQQSILQVLTPIFDPGFSESSFGFRPKRSAQSPQQSLRERGLQSRSSKRFAAVSAGAWTWTFRSSSIGSITMS
ncbi:Group II intron-encoded protein LtrA [Stieleria neptunia]|uniref:Group II intron-encoded protein LtrA n=1 Tax=Stieleria neptunia TaxID=2527979 RepID=A0A518HK84_9BACT|nr:Group II intron-encoded protein LtrA [Stieleria neptunia]